MKKNKNSKRTINSPLYFMLLTAALQVLLLQTVLFCQKCLADNKYKPQPQNLARAFSSTVANDLRSMPWQDISRAPSNFPIPIFRGNQTQFLLMSQTQSMARSMSPGVKQIQLQTKDHPSSIIQWYRAILPNSGFKIDDKYPNSSQAHIQTLRAESPKYIAVIAVIARANTFQPPQSQSPSQNLTQNQTANLNQSQTTVLDTSQILSQVQINVMPKPDIKAK